MKIVPRKTYKRIMSIVLACIVAVAIGLGIGTAVVGLKPSLDVVKSTYGTLNMKDMTFTPNIDDFDMKDIGVEGRTKFGLYYKELFKNADKSLRRYILEAGAHQEEGSKTKIPAKDALKKGEDFFELSSKTKTIKLHVKQKKTFKSKYKTVEFTVKWDNIAFGRNEKGEEIQAIKKERFKDPEYRKFSKLEEALKIRQDKGLFKHISLTDHDLAVSGDIPFVAKSGKIEMDDEKKDKEYKELIESLKEYTLYPKEAKDAIKDQYPVRVYTDDGSDTKTLRRFKMIRKNSEYQIPSEIFETCETWYSKGNSNPINYDDAQRLKNEDKGKVKVNSTLYIYGVPHDLSGTTFNIEYKFENLEGEYKPESFAKLNKSSFKKYIKKNEQTSVRGYNIMSDETLDQLIEPSSDTYKKKKIGYTLSEISIKDENGQEVERQNSTDAEFEHKESKKYDVTFKYKRNDISLDFRDYNGISIDNDKLLSLGIRDQKEKPYKFGDRLMINPFEDGSKKFDYWELKSGDKVSKVENGWTILDENVLTERTATFKAVEKDNDKNPILMVDYKTQNVNGEYVDAVENGYQRTIKRLDSGEPIPQSELEKYINKTAPSKAYKGYDVFDGKTGDKIIGDISVSGNSYTHIEVRFKRKSTIVQFKKKETNDVVDDSKFEEKFYTKEYKMYYGAKFNEDVLDKNKPNGQKIEGGVDYQLEGWQVENSSGDYDVFDIEKYINEPASGKELKNTLDIYATWKTIAKINLKIKLQDQDGNGYGNQITAIEEKLKFDNLKVGDPLAIGSKLFRDKVKEKINAYIEKIGLGNATADEIFDFEKLTKTGSDSGSVSSWVLKKDDNTFDVEVDRMSCDATVTYNFDYANDTIRGNINRLNGTTTVLGDEAEGLGKLQYQLPNIPQQNVKIYKNNNGKYKFDLKDATYAKKEYNGLKIAYQATNPETYKKAHYVLDKIKVGGKDKAYGEVEIPADTQSTLIEYEYKPNTFKLSIDKGSNSVTLHNNQSTFTVSHMDTVNLKAPTNSTVGQKAFAGWVYKDGNQISKSLLNYSNQELDADYIMPGRDMEIKPTWSNENVSKVEVNLLFEKLDGSFEKKHTSTVPSSQAGGLWLKGDQVDITKYTQTTGNEIADEKFEGFEFSTTDTLASGNGVEESSGTYKYTVQNAGLSYVNVYFKRKNVTVKYVNGYESIGTAELPDPETVKFGGKVANKNAAAGDFRRTSDNASAIFRGWSLEDNPNAQLVDLRNFIVNKGTMIPEVKLYARWHNLTNISLRAKVEFEQPDGTWLQDGKAADYISENEFELEKVTAGFDGEDGDTKRPNLYRDKIRKKIKNHTYFMTDESDIQYKDGNGDVDVEISESNTVWTYKVFRKTFTVTLNTADADGADHTVSSVAETVANTNNKELKYRYGQKPANNPIVTDSQAYKFKEWQLNGEKFEFNGTKEITQDITITAIFDINLRRATLQLGNLVADTITYPVEDGVTADYSKVQDGIIELTIRGDKLPYELKPLSFTGTIYDKVTHQPLAVDNDGMYNNTTIFDNITVNVRSNPNLDKFKGFYPQDEASAEDSEAVKNLGVKHEFYEELVENSKFHWSHTYYRGEKYESLGEKIFKYSLVELEDSPLESGSKTTKSLLDIFIGHGNDGGTAISYDQSILKAYINKVIKNKLGVDTHLPYINGKVALRQYADVDDNTIYNNETYEYYKKKSIDSRTQYSSYVSNNYKIVRQVENYPMYEVRNKYLLATATQYAYFKDGISQLKSGLWCFWINGADNHGKIYSSYYWYKDDPNMASRYDIQLII